MAHPDISTPMCQPGSVTDTTTDRAARIDAIQRAAVPVFAANGFRRTSMADLAEAAGVSRPALYQYFDNRADVFRAAFGTMLEESTDAALAALHEAKTVADGIDGYLQRLGGDAYEQLAATDHGDELMEAKHEFAADVADAAIARARAGLRAFLAAAGAGRTTLDSVMSLVTLSPMGLKSDRPAPAVYRRRLHALAEAAAGLVDA